MKLSRVFVLVGLAACAQRDERGASAAKGEARGASASASAIAAADPLASSSAAPPSSGVAPSTSVSTTAPDAAPPGADARKGTQIVHIGDSFTEASFEQNLRSRFAAVGAKYWVKAKTPSYTTTWAYGDEVDGMLWGKPALALITLGANEIDMEKPELHAAAVRALVKKISKWAGACVWITPPLWKPDKGILRVIQENCAPCLFFDSDKHVHDVERQRDKIHPNEAGGAKWAAAFWDWLEAHRDPSRGPWALVAGSSE